MRLSQIEILLLLLFFPVVSGAVRPVQVLVDPGHGGSDHGAVFNGVKESEIALKISQELKILAQKEGKIQISLTRENDRALSLQDRVDIASRSKADLLLSIHANSSPDPRARGLEIYFQNQLPPDEESLFLAAIENQIPKNAANEAANASDVNSVANNDLSKNGEILSIVEDLKRQHRMRQSHQLSLTLFSQWENTAQALHSNVIRQAPFFVISRSPMPSVLVELGFLSNEKDSARLKDPEQQKLIAKRLYNGLMDYLAKSRFKSEAKLASSTP